MLMCRFKVSFVRATKVLSILCSKHKQTTRAPGRGGTGVVALCYSIPWLLFLEKHLTCWMEGLDENILSWKT